MKKQIALLVIGAGWSIDLIDDSKIKELCGTTILQLPFTKEADYALVAAHVKAQYPEADIFLRLADGTKIA